MTLSTAFASDMSFAPPSNLSGLVTSPLAAVSADFTGDGTMDLAVLGNNSSSVTLLRGIGGGTFQNAGTIDTGLFYPTKLAAGDFNHDGTPDLAIISDFSDTVTILTNTGSGSFSGPAAYAAAGYSIKGIAAGDFNGDGWDDLALLNSNDTTVSLHLNNLSGSFSVSPDSTISEASTIKAADYNHDGRADLLEINTSGNSVSILLGQANGSFAAGPSVSVTSPLSAAMADFDGDGNSDLAILGSSGTAFVLPGIGDGSFGAQLPVASGLSPADIAAADFNNDGKSDLVMTNNQFMFGPDLVMALNTTTHLWSETYPKPGTAGATSIQLLVKILVPGTVYVVCVPAPQFGSGPEPSSEQVKNGQDGFGNQLNDNLKGSVAVAATAEGSITCSGLSTTTVYDMFVVAEATSPPYLQPTPIKISIATTPETPVLNPATNIAGRGFTASWSYVAFATSYQLDVSTAPDFSSFVASFNNRDVGFTNSFEVTGLSPGTSYYFRVRAVYSGSASASSTSEGLTTLPVPDTPVLGAATDQTPYGFTANWGAVADAAGYYIDVASDAGFTAFVNIYENYSVGNQTSFPIFPGTAGATVYYRVRAYNGNGSSNSSDPAVITLPPATPFAGTVTTATTSGFIAYWGPSDGATGYRLDVASDPDFTTFLPFFSNRDVGNVTSFLVSGTTAGVTYYYRVRGYNSGRDSIYSQTISVAVPAVPPLKLNAPRAYLAGSGPTSTVSADFNGDGVLDVAVSSQISNSVTILLGAGDGGFVEAASYASGAAPVKIAAGDLNSDSKTDLITVDSSGGSLSIFLGNGDGTFMAAMTTAVTAGINDVAIGDFTGDGKPDVAVPSPLGSSFSLLAGNGDGTFNQLPEVRTTYYPRKLVAVDFNKDGKLDLAITNSAFSSFSVYLGNGNGTFQPELLKFLTNTGELAHIATGNLNGDSNPDLVITSYETAPSGIGAIHIMLGGGDGSFTAQPAIPCGKYPQALALADLDNDNKLDILAVTEAGDLLELLYGTGDGTFTAAVTLTTPGHTNSVNASDFNGDGRRDIALTSFSANLITVFQQKAVAKTFIGAPANFYPGTGIPGSLASGDFDKDGKTDLAAALHNSSLVATLRGDGAGQLTARTDISLDHTPTGILVTDLNKDGAGDIITNGDSSAQISVALSSGNGTFQPPVSYAADGAQYRTASGDFNGDGNPDLAVANPYAGTVSILPGNGSGAFGPQTIFGAGSFPYDVASGDFNSDGMLDLAVTNNDPAASVLYILTGNGAGAFAAPVPYPLSARSDSVVTADFNLDGKLDLALSNTEAGTVSVLPGNGDGSFGALAEYPAGVAPYAMIQMDLNNDGFADLVTANGNGYLSVLLGKGDGTLLPAAYYWAGNSTAITAGPFSSSGSTDLAVGDASRGGVMLLLNTTYPSLESGYPRIRINGESTAQVLLKATITGTAYAICLPAGSTLPTPYQIKNGLDSSYAALAAGKKGSVAITAHTPAVIAFSALEQGVTYDVYVILEDSAQLLQQTPAFVSFTQPPAASYSLAVSVSGIGTVTGSSATTGDPGVINCSSGTCTAIFPVSRTVNLSAAAAWYSSVSWGNVTSSSGNTASVLMDAPKDVTVSFSMASNARLSSPAGIYGSIAAALASVLDGSTVTITARSIDFPDPLTFARRSDTVITLDGGWANLLDSSASGVTTITGKLLISSGRVNVKGVRLRP